MAYKRRCFWGCSILASTLVFCLLSWFARYDASNVLPTYSTQEGSNKGHGSTGSFRKHTSPIWTAQKPSSWNTSFHDAACPLHLVGENHIDSLVELSRVEFWHTTEDTTDGGSSTFRILNQRDSEHFTICDRVHIKIEARNWKGKRKTYGGDYFRAKLSSVEKKASVNPDYIIDLGDGSYDVFFTLKWSGETRVDITLVYPSEAVSVINRIVDTVSNRFSFTGRYVLPGGDTVTESTECDVEMQQDNLCNYSDPRVFAPWYCVKPSNKMLKCDHLQEVCNDDQKSILRLSQITSDKERAVFNKIKTPLQGSGLSFHVGNSSSPTSYQRLPFCKLNRIPNSISASGFFLNDTWHPFDCEVKHFTKTEMIDCLTGKTILMYGDSTIRQFLEYLSPHLGGFQTLKVGRNIKLGPQILHNPVHDITLKHQFHGLPMRLQCEPIHDIHCVANELDGLDGGPDVIILISLWAHFQKTSIELYERRIMGILDSVERLLLRSPETTVVFKGANTCHLPSFFWAVCASDLISYRLDYKLRQLLFKSKLNVGFLDSWDLTTAHHSADDTHPNDVIVGGMINLVLTHYCH